MRRRAVERGADGFTMIELLVVIFVLGIIVLPIATATIVGLRTADRTASVLVSSSDRQFLTIHLTPDLESSSSVDTAAATGTGCSGASPGTNVLRLQWREFVASGTPTTTVVTTYHASYRVVGDGANWGLVRYGCTSGGPPTVTTVARGLQSGTAATATVSGSQVSLAITDTLGGVYTVSATRRTP